MDLPRDSSKHNPDTGPGRRLIIPRELRRPRDQLLRATPSRISSHRRAYVSHRSALQKSAKYSDFLQERSCRSSRLCSTRAALDNFYLFINYLRDTALWQGSQSFCSAAQFFMQLFAKTNDGWSSKPLVGPGRGLSAAAFADDEVGGKTLGPELAPGLGVQELRQQQTPRERGVLAHGRERRTAVAREGHVVIADD